MIVLVFVLMVQKESSKGKDESVREKSAYFKRVLRDLDIINKELKLNKVTFNKIRGVFEDNLEMQSGEKIEERKVAKKSRKIRKKTRKTRKSHRSLSISSFVTEFSASLLLFLGSFLIIAAALILIAFSWDQLNDFIKAALLPLFTLLFLIAGVAFYQLKKVRLAGKTFLILSEILIPLSFASFWRFALRDQSFMSFWTYWTLVSMIFLILSSIYNKFLKNYFTKAISVFGLFSLIVSISLAFEFEMLNTILYIATLNLGVVLFFKLIKDPFLRISIFIVSNILNILLILFSFVTLFFDMIFQFGESNQYEGFYYQLVIFALFLVFILYFVAAYLSIKKGREFYYAVLLPFFMFEIIYFGLIWSVSIGIILVFLSLSLFGVFILEKYLKTAERKFEELYSFILSIFLSVFIVLITFFTRTAGEISNFWVYLLISLVIGYFLLRYVVDKFSLYLGIAAFLSLYPIVLFVASISFSVDYVKYIFLYFISIVYSFGSVVLARLRARRSAYSLIPSFIALNTLSLFGMLALELGTFVFGLLMVVNLLVYLMLSLLVINGKFTQICVIWALGAVVYLAYGNITGGQLGLLFKILGCGAFFLNDLIDSSKKVWNKLDERELVNIIKDLKITNYIFSFFSFYLALFIGLAHSSNLAVVTLTLILVFLLYLAYRYGQTRWLLAFFIMIYIWLIKFICNYDIDCKFWDLCILSVAVLSYITAYEHTSKNLLLKGFMKFKNAFLNFSLINFGLVFLTSLFNIWCFGEDLFFVQSLFMLITILIMLQHGFKEKSLIFKIIPFYMLLLYIWRTGINYEISNAQYYFVSLGLAFHSTNLILREVKNKLAPLGIFDILGILIVLGISLLMSITDGLYLIALIVEGVFYVLMWPYFGKKSFAVFAAIIVGIGILIKTLTLIISFPQWLIFGIAGLFILTLAVLFLLLRREK